MADSAPAPAPAPSDSERITALETKLSALITLLKGGLSTVTDGGTEETIQVFSLTSQSGEMNSL